MNELEFVMNPLNHFIYIVLHKDSSAQHMLRHNEEFRETAFNLRNIAWLCT